MFILFKEKSIIDYMKYILIGSPDKLSLGSFIRFIRKQLPDHAVADMHSLMSKDSMDMYISDLKNKHEKCIISFYAKKQINADPLKILSQKLQDSSDVIIWFDLYSMDIKIIKDPGDEINKTVSGPWKQYIQKIS